jgi:hypothetical protein
MKIYTDIIHSRSAGLVREDRSLERCGSLGMIFARLVAMMLLAFAGCSASSGSAHPVDTSRARDALKTALDHWKSGKTPQSLSSSATPMTVQDFDWEAGVKLVDYQIQGEGEPVDANLRIQVKLNLGPGKGKTKSGEKTVSYLVGTSPSVTVFRDMFRR